MGFCHVMPDKEMRMSLVFCWQKLCTLWLLWLEKLGVDALQMQLRRCEKVLQAKQASNDGPIGTADLSTSQSSTTPGQLKLCSCRKVSSPALLVTT